MALLTYTAAGSLHKQVTNAYHKVKGEFGDL